MTKYIYMIFFSGIKRKKVDDNLKINIKNLAVDIVVGLLIINVS
ncbi:MAG: hypothetical protein PHE29_05750 [Tissierellia bacterium]|nr:hypothetical protein [Tissierellia bacterium]